jgi:hypothetical protein
MMCVQGVFYPGSNLLAEQGLTGKGLGGIDGLSSGNSHPCIYRLVTEVAYMLMYVKTE